MRFSAVVLSITFGVGLSCAAGPFDRVERPVVARGVVVTLTDQSCRTRTNPSRPQDALVDLDLTVQIRNTGIENATFDPSGLRLLSNGTSTAPIEAPHVEMIRPGSGLPLDVHFAGESPLACDQPMTLVVDRALKEGATPATGQSIAFVARKGIAFGNR